MKKETIQPGPRMSKATRKSPENRDELDSRKNEEQRLKGDDVTHNRKETRESHRKNS